MSVGGASLLGTSVLELRTDQRPLNAGLAQARVNADRTGAQMQASMDKRMMGMGRSMQSVGSSMSRHLTLPIVALGVATGDMAVKFQQSMEMIHTQAGASQKEVGNLTNQVLALARTLPQSPQQLAQGLFHLESIGLRGAKAMDALKIAAQGAAVGNADLESTTTALGSAWLVNIKGAGDLRNVMGILNATVGAGNMKMQELVDALGTGVLPSAKNAGLGIKDVMGALAVFTDEGYNASSAAAQFATALHFLTNPTLKAIGALGNMGIGADQLAKDMHKPQGLLTALRDLEDHLSKLKGGAHGVAAEQTIGAIFPGGRGRVMLTLLNQLDRYNMKLGQISKNTKNFSQDIAATQQTDAYKIHTAWSTIQADAIQFGDKVLPELLKVGGEVLGGVDKVAQAFTSLPKAAQDAIITGGLVIAGIGPALKLMGVFTSGVGRLWSIAKSVERIAAKPIGGLFSRGAGAAGAAGGMARANMVVDTMEVANLIARGGAAGLGGGFNRTDGSSGAQLTSAEASTAEGAAGGGAALTLGRLVPIIGTLAAAAIGLKSAAEALGHGKGLLGADRSFIQSTIGQVDPGIIKQLQTAVFGGGGVQHASPAQIELMKFTDQVNAVKGDLNKLTPEALIRLKQEAERLAADPALVKYRSKLLDVLKGLGNVADTAKGQGVKIAQSLEKGWNSFKFQSEPIMVNQLLARVKNLPPQMRASAIESAIQFAKGLQAKGRLAPGAWQTMLLEINHLMPGWQRSLGLSARLSAATFTQNLDLSKAEQNVHHSLDKMSHDFPEVRRAMDQTKGDMVDKSAAVVRALESIQAIGSGALRRQATKDLNALRQVVTSDLQKMTAVAISSAHDMAHAIQHGSLFAAQAAEANFARVSSAVTRAMAAGTVSSREGTKLIADALNAELKAFGSKPLPIPAIPAFTGPSSTPGAFGHGARASGGYIGDPGERGRDTVPVMLGRGEAVLNHPQQRIANSFLAGIGGLPGLFRRTSGTLHYMASGGYAGYALPLPRSMMANQSSWSVDQGVDIPGGAGGEPEYAIGPGRITAEGIGGFGPDAPVLTISTGPLAGKSIYYGHAGPDLVPVGASVRAGQQISSVGQGIVGISTGPHIEIGFSDTAGNPVGTGTSGPEGSMVLLLQQLLGGAGVAGIGGGALFKQIKVPKVSGSGTLSTMLRAGFGKVTKAANSYLAKQFPMIAPGFAPSGSASTSGAYNLGSLESLWLKAGGSPSAAHIMAAVALAESSGNPSNTGPTDSAGNVPEGLWQIKMPLNAQYIPGGNAFDPLANAEGAAAMQAAFGFSPWETYTTGAYRQFMASGGFAKMAQRLAKGGLAGAWRVNASSEESPGQRGYYNIYPGGVSSYSLSSGKGYSILSTPGTNTAAGRATAGHALGPGAVWPHPSWAILGRNGKTTKVSVQDIGAGDSSAPTIGIYPDTIRYLGGTPGSDLANVNIERADGHPFSALRGTPIPYFGPLAGKGGKTQQQGPKVDHMKLVSNRGLLMDRLKAGKRHKGMGQLGRPDRQRKDLIPPLSFSDPKIKNTFHALNSLIGQRGEIASLQDLSQQTDSMFQLKHPNLNYVVTQDQFGNPVLPYIDQIVDPKTGEPIPNIDSPHAVNASLGELMMLHQWQAKVVGDYERALRLIGPLLKWLTAAIERRRRRMNELKARIARNLERMKRLAQKVKHEQDRIKHYDRDRGIGSHHLTHAGVAARQTSDRRIHGWRQEIHHLRGQNQWLGGSPTGIGHGGMIGKLMGQVGSLNDRYSTVYGDQLQIAGPSGVGGDLGGAKVQLATINQQIGQLSPGLLKGQLKAAQGQYTSGSDQALISDLQAKLSDEARTVAIERAEIKVFSQPLSLGALPPFGGSFATGGTVPGMLGEPRTIIAHGGETVTPPGDGPDVRVVVEDHRVRVFVNDVERIVDQRMRTTARNAARKLPGAGGGLRVGR